MSTVSDMSDVPAQHDGWDLHLAPGTVSGYKNVKFLKNNKTRPYSVQFTHAGATKYLGAFATAVEAAVEYAKFVSEGGGGAAPSAKKKKAADDDEAEDEAVPAAPVPAKKRASMESVPLKKRFLGGGGAAAVLPQADDDDDDDGGGDGAPRMTAREGAAAEKAKAAEEKARVMATAEASRAEEEARARDAEAFKGGMTVKEINAAFGERAGELKKPAKRVGLIDMGLIHLFMM